MCAIETCTPCSYACVVFEVKLHTAREEPQAVLGEDAWTELNVLPSQVDPCVFVCVCVCIYVCVCVYA